jgi:DNA helicase II / ATP-dependent DNA helicase PcrA
MRILLAGPGTGKTTRIKQLIQHDFPSASRVLVLSFTNATVNVLSNAFSEWPNVNCYTLHKYALKINHLTDVYILDSQEQAVIEKFCGDLRTDSTFLYGLLKCISFNGMIAECLRFLRSNETYAQETIGDLDLLIVDEYQDFNQQESDLVQVLSNYARDTIILGDDDQSIYGFKDADPDGIISLYRDEHVSKIEHENKCYRCPDEVVDCASHLIDKNRNRIRKPWHKTGKPGEVVFRQILTPAKTNEFILSEIQTIRSKRPADSILVLSPVGFHVPHLTSLLESNGIDYVNFWDTQIDQEVLTLIWIIRTILTSRKLLNLVLLASKLPSPKKIKFKENLAVAIVRDFDQQDFIRSNSALFGPIIADNIEVPPELTTFAKQHPEYEQLLQKINPQRIEASAETLLRIEKPQKEFSAERVNLMSIHKSKGLQADVVFVTSLVDGVLPNATSGIDTIEAQRRLLFVGLTRSMHRLYVLSSVQWDGADVHRVDKAQFKYFYKTKKYNARTSKFVDEMK